MTKYAGIPSHLEARVDALVAETEVNVLSGLIAQLRSPFRRLTASESSLWFYDEIEAALKIARNHLDNAQRIAGVTQTATLAAGRNALGVPASASTPLSPTVAKLVAAQNQKEEATEVVSEEEAGIWPPRPFNFVRRPVSKLGA